MHLGRTSFKQAPAVIHHHDPVRNIHHQIHVVLDQDDRRSIIAKRPDTIEKAVDFRSIKARRGLIDQQELRFCCKRTRELEHPLFAI